MIRTSGQMWNAAGDPQDAKAVLPDSSYAGIYQVVIDDCRAHGAFDPATMGSVPNVGLMAQAAEEYGSHDKTFEIPTRRHRAGGRHARAPRCSSTRSRRATSGACARPRTPPSQDWVKLAVTRARATGAPAVFWLDATRAHDAQVIEKVAALPRRPRDRRPPDRDHGAGRRDGLLARAHPPRRGHDLGHRQRAARLPHRPLPDHGARHQRQDALDRAADERRRALRDRRRRLRPEARPAAREGELPALGLARRVPRAGGVVRAPGHDDGQQAGPGAGRHARRGHRRRCSTTASRRPAGSARSTTGAATSTWRATGPRRSPPRATTRSWPPPSPRWPSGWRPTRTPSTPSCSASRATRPTSAATTPPTPPRPRPSCARPPPSTRPSRRSRDDAAALARRVQHRHGVRQQDPRRRGRAGASASAAASCRASTCTPTSATRRCEAWGLAWLERGTMRARFHQPVYDGHRVDITPGADGRLELRDEAGELCAPTAPPRCRSSRPRAPTRLTGPTSEQADDPPPASPEVLVPGTALRPGAARLPRRPRTASTSPTCARPRRSTPPRASPTRAGSCATPTTCSRPTSASGRGSTSSRSCSTTTSSTTARRSRRRALVTKEWEHKGHRFVELDVLHLADLRPVARTTHTAIYQPRGA